MNLDLSLVNILILFGAVQGLTFMVILFANKRHPGAIYLGLVLLALVYNGLETFNWSANLEQYTTFFDYFPFVLIFLIGPSFYLYQHSLLYDTAFSRRKILLLYSPFFFQFGYLSICWIAHYLTKTEILNFQPWLRMAGQFYGWYSEPLSVIVYLAFAAGSIRDFLLQSKAPILDKKRLKNRQATLAWVKQLLVFQMILALIWTPTVIISNLGVWPFSWSEYYPVEILLVIFLYWIAIAGYFKIRAITEEPTRVKEPSVETHQSATEMALIREAVEMDHLYRNPELSLALLSEKTGIAPKQISRILNQVAGMNFNDFVNSYRVEAFCRELKKTQNTNLTLLGIANSCGFNSSATFQRTFKKLKGVTPGTYFQRRQEMGESGG